MSVTCVRKLKDLRDVYVPLHCNALQMLLCSNLNRRKHNDTTVLDLIPTPAGPHDQPHDWLLASFANGKWAVCEAKHARTRLRATGEIFFFYSTSWLLVVSAKRRRTSKAVVGWKKTRQQKNKVLKKDLTWLFKRITSILWAFQLHVHACVLHWSDHLSRLDSCTPHEHV